MDNITITQSEFVLPIIKDRQEAINIVNPYIEQIDQYLAVSHENCLKILGETVFAEILSDPIKGKGPKRAYIYYWNLLDYLQGERVSIRQRRKG